MSESARLLEMSTIDDQIEAGRGSLSAAHSGQLPAPEPCSWRRVACRAGGISGLLLCVGLYLSRRCLEPTLQQQHRGSDFSKAIVGKNAFSDFCGEVDYDIEYHTKASLYWVGNIASPNECCAECDADPDCGAWTYGQAKGREGLTNHCYLKTLAEGEEPEKVPRKGVVSGRISNRLGKHGVVAELLAKGAGKQPRVHEIQRSGTCPGRIDVEGYGSMQVVAALWKIPGERAAPVDVPSDGWAVMPRLNSRAYLAEQCEPGVYRSEDYAALKLLGGSFRYTVDLSRAGCGCNAQMHLIPMRFNQQESGCHDFFCSHGWSRCGGVCADIGVQDSNKYAWSSQLHVRDDHGGASAGYGGGDDTWVGRRSWSESQYGPGARCIDTTWPFDVEVSFPVDSRGMLEAMEVTLSQDLHPCPLKLRIDRYSYDGRDGLAELSEVLEAGVTPTIRYWSSRDLKWMDGAGPDGQGPCVMDAPEACPESVRFYNFAVSQKTAAKQASPLGNSAIESALDEVHEETETEVTREREAEATKLEEKEFKAADRVDDKIDGRVVDLKVGGKDVVVSDAGTGAKMYDQIINGNTEWEVVADRVLVRSGMDPSEPIVGTKIRGEVLVGSKVGRFLRVVQPSEVLIGAERHGVAEVARGYVSLEGLQERTVSYVKIVRGTCADAGKFPIQDTGACAAAALALGYFDTHVRVYMGTERRPEGCYLLKGNIWLATSPANEGNGADRLREPLCGSSEYITTTTTTTTVTTTSTTWGWPSLFCIEVTRATGYEFPLVQEQMKQRASIFSCDEYAVFSDGGEPRRVGIEPDGSELKTIVIPAIVESIGNLAAGATTNSWLNTKTFLQVWDICKKDGRFSRHDWSVKVDPDAVFFPHRLRWRLESHTKKGAKLYVMNCNRFNAAALYGSMEVFSTGAMETYLAGQDTCKTTLPWHGWGEDYFMSHCMDLLGVGRVYDFSLLSDKRCMYSPCSDQSKVSFHDYKDARPNGTWWKCYHQSMRR